MPFPSNSSHPLPPDVRPAVALAILYQGDRFLMQLRDNVPGIVYPGHWGFFGGHLEPGETPEVALLRELAEEIGYVPAQVKHFQDYETPQVIRHVFAAELTVPVSELVLTEGWDLDLVTVEEIQQGDRYSVKADQVRPLGPPHQQILLDFIAQNLSRHHDD